MWSFNMRMACMWGMYWICIALHTRLTDAELISLDDDCHITWRGSVSSYPFTCTCRKIDNSTDGNVFWFYPNGTSAPQKMHSGNNMGIPSSEMIFDQPPSTKTNHRYVCGLVSSSWQRLASLNYSANFCFGPQSATLRRKDAAENPAPVYTVCAGKSLNVSLECEYPTDLISDTGMFHLYVDSQMIPQPGYGYAVGDVVESSNVVRADLTVDLEEGFHEVACLVMNSCNSIFAAKAILFIQVVKKIGC